MTGHDALEHLLRAGLPGAMDAPPDLTEVAAEAGLLDVAYATMDTAVGRLLLACTPLGLVRIDYLEGDQEDERLADLARRPSSSLSTSG